eukprot:m.107767 g.107767  ORF g.107767 m.107767 type:complete len:51 (-) comp10633_c0_seq3:1518-1670(-)
MSAPTVAQSASARQFRSNPVCGDGRAPQRRRRSRIKKRHQLRAAATTARP